MERIPSHGFITIESTAIPTRRIESTSRNVTNNTLMTNQFVTIPNNNALSTTVKVKIIARGEITRQWKYHTDGSRILTFNEDIKQEAYDDYEDAFGDMMAPMISRKGLIASSSKDCHP
jgi:small-conductance mechanosensitive channel